MAAENMNRFKQAFDFLRNTKTYKVLFYNDPDDTLSRRAWSDSDYLRANEISLYTNRAISKRAEKVSEIEFYLTNAKGDRVDEHELLTLLNKPNEFMTGLQFWGLYQKYRDLTGKAFIWKVTSGEFSFDRKNKVSELILLRPDCVTVEYSEGKISGYLHSGPDGKNFRLSPDEVIYLYTPDPSKPTEGMSILKAGTTAIDTEYQLSLYHANIVRNGGAVGNIIKFTAGLTQKQVVELKEAYRAQYAGAKNAGEPMFLGGDADIVKTGLNPTELGFIESKRMTLDDIVIMTGVPKAILGLTTGETFANADASIAIFLRETIKPQMKDLTTILNWRLVPDELTLHFVDPTPENVELRLKETESGIKNNYMTINEARAKNGLDPLPNGDVVLVPFSQMPLEQVGEKKQDPAPANDQAKTAPQEHPLRDARVRAQYGQIMVKRMDRQEIAVKNAIQNYFYAQQQRIIESVDGTKSFKHKDFVDEVFNHSVEINLAKGTIIPLIREALKRAGEDAMRFAESSYSFHLSSRIESWLELRGNTFANQITETTFEDLKAAFSASLDAGESRRQLVKRIRDVYKGYTENRAKTIARTEVHAATQNGTIEGYVQAGLQTKIWVAVGDAATRDSHASVDGEEVPINAYFSNGLKYPGDPAGSAAEVINCRCSI